MTPDEEVVQRDVADILDALGLGTHARDASTHEVIQDEVLPALREHDMVRDRVLALHKPWRAYGECSCSAAEIAARPEVHVDVEDCGLTCLVLYVVCRECCTHNEYQTEECATYHEHTLDPDDRCATVRALRGS